MSTSPELSDDGRSLTVQMPLKLQRRGGRKRVVVPTGEPAWAPPQAQGPTALVKALARAHRWQAMLEGGQYGSIAELAAGEGISASYLSRLLRLTLLAPEIVDLILGGQEGADQVAQDAAMNALPLDWLAQSAAIRLSR